LLQPNTNIATIIVTNPEIANRIGAPRAPRHSPPVSPQKFAVKTIIDITTGQPITGPSCPMRIAPIPYNTVPDIHINPIKGVTNQYRSALIENCLQDLFLFNKKMQ
jgi:hypothetical protein